MCIISQVCMIVGNSSKIEEKAQKSFKLGDSILFVWTQCRAHKTLDSTTCAKIETDKSGNPIFFLTFAFCVVRSSIRMKDTEGILTNGYTNEHYELIMRERLISINGEIVFIFSLFFVYSLQFHSI